MKEQLRNLVQLLRESSGPVRVVLATGLALVVGLFGWSVYRARNPYMTFLVGDLSNEEFSAVTSALGTAGIRFDTSTGGPPFSVFVDEGRKFDARNAIALEGALSVGPRGIDTSGGSSSVFKSGGERAQEMNARYWEEVEMQLERLSWISSATVTASMPPRTLLGREKPPQVAVVLQTHGLVHPDAGQRSTVATLVQRAFGVPPENIMVTDQHGATLFDGREDDSLTGLLEFELAFTETETRRAQELLDRSFGEGMTVVSVKGEWRYDRRESVGETIDPKKLVMSETASDTSTPSGGTPTGGPAGTAANISLSGPAPASAPRTQPATTSETKKDYEYATTTTHTLSDKPALERLSITLLVDSSLEPRLDVAADFVQKLVGYREGRDDFQGSAVELATVARDAEGRPLALEEPVPREVPSATMTLLLERGVEILAALGFLFVLLRSLKRGKPAAAEAAENAPEPEPQPEEEIDLDQLARRRIDEILENDPEKVGALLTRWALGESEYAESAR